MGQRLRLIVGSLVGAVSIHVALAACGSSVEGGASSDAGGAGILDALVDAITGRDARADADAGSGASSCGCTTPIRTVTASEDPAQWVSAAAKDTAAPQKLVDGPFVLRRATTATSGATTLTPVFFIAKDGQCGAWANVDWSKVLGASDPNRWPAVTGFGAFDVYIPVPAGAALCYGADTATGPTSGAITWAGFRPYP